MQISHSIALYALQARFEKIPTSVVDRLKLHLLDALGCALGAMEGPPVKKLRTQIRHFGGRPLCSLIGGGKSSPDRAACYNTALTRYLDFMDNFMAEGETCHPGDNIGSVLTTVASGR